MKLVESSIGAWAPVLIFSLLMSGCGDPVDLPTLAASLETSPVASGGDAADDSVVIALESGVLLLGTNKRKGLEVYEASGELVQQLDRGRLNNVDATFDDSTDAHRVAASNRTNSTVDVFSVSDAEAEVSFVKAFPVPLTEPYGLCVSSDAIFVGDKEGLVIQYSWSGLEKDRYQFDTQTEGCVVDEQDGQLFVGEEGRGIWRVDLASAERTLFAAIDGNARGLVADVEGLDLYQSDDARYLVASSQGDNTFIVYDLDTATQLTKFRVGPSDQIDGVSETDGIAVYEGTMPGFPDGALIVQDGVNEDNGDSVNQNFKWINWAQIQALLVPSGTNAN